MYPLPSAAGRSSVPAFDDLIQQRRANSDSRLHYAISHSSASPDTIQRCLKYVKHLHVHRNLFFHTYMHLASCKRSDLTGLVNGATLWKEWRSVQQLARQALIREQLRSFWTGHPCHQHQFLFAQRFVVDEDHSDLLWHVLYCRQKEELYDLSRRPAISGHGGSFRECEQVIELLWQLLMKRQEGGDVVHRLRACIYRMTRKSAYLPRALQIQPSSLSNEQPFRTASGANGLMTLATMDGKQVVVKKILYNDRDTRRKCLEMFASEAILWGTLQHRNIAPFLGVVGQDFSMGLVSLFFRNGNVKTYLKRFDYHYWPDMASRLSRDLAEALKYIHSHDPPIIHGDLKGDNVFVDDSDHACLGDFGQSYASDSGRYLDSTRVGLPAHSPYYWMAPELMGDEDVVKASAKSDIYSFACVVYEMISGSIPFEGLPVTHVAECVQRGQRPPKPRSISKDNQLWKVVENCWKPNPEERPSARRLVSLYR